MALMSQESQTKGSNFIGLLKAVVKLHGPPARDDVIKNLSGELADAIEHETLLAMSWYPARWYAALHTAVDAALAGGPEFARTLGRTTTQDDFTKLHRLVVSMLRPETVFGQAPRIVGLYFRGGKIELLEIGPGRARVRFAGWPDFNRLVWEDLLGSIEGILDVCGAKKPTSRPVQALERADTVDIIARWT
ncbi:MAG TPA: hypothetical protein VFX59_30750 [Polyangiales bacterium]|nr:hypothetical protein [Polyangiales bacterium]